MDKKMQRNITIIVIVVVIVIAIILYTTTLGKCNIATDEEEKGKPFDERKKIAENRHRKLITLIEKKKELKLKLAKKFRYAYLGVRFAFILLYLGFNGILYFVFGIKEIDTVLNWNQAAGIAFLGLNFLCFGSVSNLKSVIHYFKNTTENLVFKGYIDIDKEIESHQEETTQLVGEIQSLTVAQKHSTT